MRKLGIIQPGKIGDIIICLPIAKYYYDRGWTVIWPVDRRIIGNFVGYVDYVTFIPVDFDCRHSYRECYAAHCARIIDLSFSIPGANPHSSHEYMRNNTKFSFDEYKYFLADVDFSEKWNLQITRNKNKEEELYNKLVNHSGKYIVLQEQSSVCHIKAPIKTELDTVKIEPIIGYSVFDWLKILEKADKHVLIESCFMNLVDQMNIKTAEKYLMNTPLGMTALEDGRLRGHPKLRMNWILMNKN